MHGRHSRGQSIDCPHAARSTTAGVSACTAVLGKRERRRLPQADLEALMAKYHDRPMGFADATLVHLAQRESLLTLFTVDHDDFEIYRIGGRRRFRILPSR